MVAHAVRREARVRLFPRQMRFVKDPARFPAYVGGIGSGKTFAGAVKVIARLDRKELGMVAAPTYSMLRDATQRTLLALMEDVGIVYEQHKAEGAIHIPASGHEIIFRSLDDPEKVRGPNLHYAWVDEGSLVDRMAWSIVKGRVRVGDSPQAWLTCTPKGRNYVWEEWERDANPDHPLYRVRTDENPELPPGFSESLGYTGTFAEQELGGEFVAFEGLVYKMFSRPAHVQRIDCDGWRTIIGVDIGSRHPTAIMTVRGEPERRHVEHEVYRPGMNSDEITAAICAEADRANPDKIFFDPSAKAYIDTLKSRGYPAEKAENDVKFGVGQVSTALATMTLEGEPKAPDLTIDPSCVNLIAELESYHWPENKTISDTPVKEFDDACDALRYAIASEANVMTPGVWVLQ
jgi:PBSX family phage terminase large subunit